MQIIPGILEKDWEEIKKKLAIIKPFSRWVHIDFLDGKFSPETSFMDVPQFAKYKEDFYMEAHLMVDNPMQHLKQLSESGFRRFIGHIEKMKDLDEFVAEGQLLGEVGLALDIQTPLDSIKIPFDDLDCLLLMSVKAGKSGQEFDDQVLEKIEKIHQNSQIPIEVDGGINNSTIQNTHQKGAERFVATSFIFDSDNPQKAYEKLISIQA